MKGVPPSAILNMEHPWGIRPPFIDRKVMKAPKMTKTKLVDQVMALQAYIDEQEAFDKSRTMVDKVVGLDDHWFGVAYIGWGTWEEDVFFVEAFTPEDAISLFEDACKNETFQGHGYEPDDRSVWPSNEDRILVYEISEYAEYRKTKWEKV